ncbi:MAG TPA: hypothetical protein VFW71_07250 [Actinomycetota bacterium]|nr:hypothetical protein [Actinomycetota bacterium]
MEPEHTLTDGVEGCGAPVAPWGWWRRYFQRWYRLGHPLGGGPRSWPGTLCGRRGCPREARARGLYSCHDQQLDGARQAGRSAQAQ